MITLKLFIWLLYIAVDCWINFTIIEKNDARPNYLLMNIVRGGAFILYGAFVWDFQAEIWYANIFIFCTTSLWILFDLSLNIARKKHPLYIGAESGWIDRWGFKNRGLYYTCKVFVLVILVFAIINIYNP